jgi:hypothetical protein
MRLRLRFADGIRAHLALSVIAYPNFTRRRLVTALADSKLLGRCALWIAY